MAIHDFNAQRLYVDQALAPGAEIEIGQDQTNYLINVLRLAAGAEIRLFNGSDGEWLCRITTIAKRRCTLSVSSLMRAQQAGPDIDYFFAPLKRARLDYMVQKAVELGVASLTPVITHRTIVDRVNLERMRANAIEAAEQCGILRLPAVAEPVKFAHLLADWPETRALVVCDEAAPVTSAISALQPLQGQGCGLLVGPEGGFSPDERAQLLRHPAAVAISLGPRIMRADTAAVAALAVLNAAIGDWR